MAKDAYPNLSRRDALGAVGVVTVGMTSTEVRCFHLMTVFWFTPWRLARLFGSLHYLVLRDGLMLSSWRSGVKSVPLCTLPLLVI
jgi:hypothetical protein